MASEEKTVVAITGVSGYIAGPIVAALAERGGYDIRGTVRSKANPEKTAHLDGFPLTLFEADLLQPGTFDECFAGAKYVLHVASPFQPGAANPQEELIDPAVNGTNNVLEAALRCGVKRVVVTSSCAAVVQTTKGDKYADDYVWSEEDWNETASIDNNPYACSKVMAEKAAWAFFEAHPEMEVAVVNPSFVLGPPLSSRLDSTSVKFMAKLLSGKNRDGAAPRSIPINDVRDLAQAHLAVMLSPDAVGKRHCTTQSEGFTMLEIANVLREQERFQSLPLPTTYASEPNPLLRLNNARIRSLGVELRPLNETMCDMADALIERGLVEVSSG